MSLENDLRHALRREPPPAGFASRVLQRIEHEQAPKRTRWWRAVAASVTLTALLGGWAAHTIHERREGERAREQVLLALKIAGEKVRYAQQEVRTIGTND
jgi:hypothetical protein